jgi:hypothetical protein
MLNPVRYCVLQNPDYSGDSTGYSGDSGYYEDSTGEYRRR